MTVLQRTAQLVRDLKDLGIILEEVDKVVYDQPEPNKAILHIKWYGNNYYGNYVNGLVRINKSSEILKNAICAEFSKDNPEIVSTLEDHSTYCEIFIRK